MPISIHSFTSIDESITMVSYFITVIKAWDIVKIKNLFITFDNN